MKGFAKMTKVTWRFYLVALIFMLLLTVADSIYVCKEDNSAYNGKLFHHGMEKDSKEKFIEKTGGDLNSGKDIAYIYCDKANWYEIFGYPMMLFVLIVILLLKQCVFMDVRSAEFQRTFPVKQWIQVLHDYLSVLGIMVLSALLQLGIFVAYQTSYNMEMLKTAKAFSTVGGSEEIITQTNGHLLQFWGMYFLYIAMAYTFFYVGILLTKNPIMGAILSVIVLSGIDACLDIWIWNYVMPNDKDFGYWIEHIDYANRIKDIVDYIRYPQDAFSINAYTLMERNSQMTSIVACAMVGIIVLFIILMIVLGKRRELSRGKLLYFPILDYPLCFLIGVAVFWWGGDPIYLVIGIVVAVISFLLIHPWPRGKRNVLEVK